MTAASPLEKPRLRRKLLTVGVAGGAALAGVGLAWWRQQAPAPADGFGTTNNASSTAAPPGPSSALDALWNLRLVQPDGPELVMAGLRGKPLLINFWATWCAPCVREMPEIDRFHREFAPRGWQVLGLAIDGAAPVREFLSRVKVGFTIGLAGLDGTELVRSLGNAQGSLPFSVMINAKGQVLQRKLGETNFTELAAWANKA